MVGGYEIELAVRLCAWPWCNTTKIHAIYSFCGRQWRYFGIDSPRRAHCKSAIYCRCIDTIQVRASQMRQADLLDLGEGYMTDP